MILGARSRASIIETQNFPCRGSVFPFGGSTDDDISEFSLNNIGVENELDQLLSRFYRLDEMPKTRQPTYEESFCEETFEKAHFIEMRLAGISCTYRSWTKLMVWVLQGQRR